MVRSPEEMALNPRVWPQERDQPPPGPTATRDPRGWGSKSSGSMRQEHRRPDIQKLINEGYPTGPRHAPSARLITKVARG